MRTISKEQVTAKAKDIFERYPKANKVAVTSDGQAFIVDNGENAVKNHALRNRYKKELKIYRYTRDSFEGEKSNETKTVEECLKAIEGTETLDAVDSLLKEELAGRKRKTVISAAEEKKAIIAKLDAENKKAE